MASVRLLPGAVEDLRRLDTFLRAKNPIAANKLSLTLDQALKRLGRYPKLGRVLPEHPPFYELPVPFGARGYAVRYRFNGADVIVVRVWHAREDR